MSIFLIHHSLISGPIFSGQFGKTWKNVEICQNLSYNVQVRFLPSTSETGESMQRQYLNQNVYEALQSRLHFIFQEFQNIFVSFSGGKDSGLLLNLVLDFRKKYYPNRRIGVFHQDFEAQYSVTTEYIERTFARIEKEVEPYWVCLPMATRTALSNYEMYWYPWDDEKEEA